MPFYAYNDVTTYTHHFSYGKKYAYDYLLLFVKIYYPVRSPVKAISIKKKLFS